MKYLHSISAMTQYILWGGSWWWPVWLKCVILYDEPVNRGQWCENNNKEYYRSIGALWQNIRMLQYRIWIKNIVCKTSYKSVFCSHNCLLQLIETVLFYVSIDVRICLVYFLHKKDPVEQTFSPIQKCPMHCDHFLISCVPIWVLIIPDSSTRDLWQVSAETPTSKSGETWQEMVWNFAYEISVSYSADFFNMP
jgi:hypothetical protein